MPNDLIQTVISEDEAVRNRSINVLLQDRNSHDLLTLAKELEEFRQTSDNLYHKVRASLFLYVIFGYYLQFNKETLQYGKIPFEGVKAAFERDFERSISIYLSEIQKKGNHAVFSALADSYHRQSFKYLLDQVKLSISHCTENHLLFSVDDIAEYPYAVPR